MNNRIAKPNIMLSLAAVLLCLVLFTTHLTSGLYAKYTNRFSANDSARVALWEVGATGGKPALTIDCSTSDLDDEYSFKVTNKSEVAVRYDIVIVFTEALENGITLKLNGTSTPVTKDRKRFVFTDVGRLSSGNTSAEHTLTFVASSDDIEEDVSYTFSVQIDFEQID